MHGVTVPVLFDPAPDTDRRLLILQYYRSPDGRTFRTMQQVVDVLGLDASSSKPSHWKSKPAAGAAAPTSLASPASSASTACVWTGMSSGSPASSATPSSQLAGTSSQPRAAYISSCASSHLSSTASSPSKRPAEAAAPADQQPAKKPMTKQMLLQRFQQRAAASSGQQQSK